MVRWVSHKVSHSNATPGHHLFHWGELKTFSMFSLSFRHFFIAKKVLWFLFSFTFVGLIPHEKLRHWCNDKSSLIGFRIFSRSLSTVITIHNDEYKPKQCGFCVANHTSPIDIVILSTDCTYSLVSTRMLYLF